VNRWQHRAGDDRFEVRNGHIRSASIMRNKYALLLLLCVCSSQQSWAQAFGELNINNVRARFYANGRVGLDTASGLPNFEVPEGGAAHPISSGGIWVGGETSGGQTRVSSTMYDTDGTMHFFPGPLTVDGSATTTQLISDQFNHVWSVTRAEVALHLAYYQCLSDPNCDVASEFPGGYTIPASFMDWPAIGDVAQGYDLYLAPFYDFDLDGDYDPAAGDAPCILGDQALYNVFNDHLGISNGNLSLGVEVQAMPFAFNSGNHMLGQTVFVRYHLINRSSATYANTMLGFFNDFDLGCSEDDFVGCDPSRNLAYGYNWDDDDQNCTGVQGYGVQPPAFGVVLLKGPLLDANSTDDDATNVLPNWNGQGFDDGTPDNERFGLSHFTYFQRSGPNCCNDPSSTMHSYGYLRGIWKDGVTMSYGGVGYNPDPTALQCAFMYPGSGDPVGAGTGGLVQGAWSESQQVFPDRRGLMSMGALTLDPGEHIDLVFAYVYARAASGGAFASVAALQARVDSVRAFAQTLPIWNVMEEDAFGGSCADYPFLGVGEANEVGRLALFPSPATDQVQFVAPRELIGGMLTVRDATGRVVFQQRILPETNRIEIGELAKGVYTCEAVARNARYTGRIVKE